MKTEEQTVVVTVTLAVTVAERWGDDCTLGQLRAQAVRSATETIQRMYDGKMSDAERERVKVRSTSLASLGWVSR